MESLMRGAEPFYMKGSTTGCLLIHGFTGTPNELRWLGTRLAADGYTVLGVRLAGHGTSVEHMNVTRWRDWYASAVDGYEALRRECEHVFIIGLSMGGMFALMLAARNPVSGVVALATPAHIRNWRLRAFRPLQRLIPYWDALPSDIQDAGARADHLQYDRYPTACILSLLEVNKFMRRELPRVHAPTLLVSARQDSLAPPSNMRYIANHLGTPDWRMVVLERGGHSVAADLERDTVLAHVRAFVAKQARPRQVVPVTVMTDNVNRIT